MVITKPIRNNIFKVTIMQAFTKVVAIAAASIAISFSAQATPAKLTKSQEATLVQICQSATRTTLRFIHTLKRNNLRTRTVAENVVCNGLEIAEFARLNGASKIADRLNRSLGIKADVSIRDIAKTASKKAQNTATL